MKLFLLCAALVAAPAAAHDYQEAIARNKMYPAAVAAYDQTAACIANNFKNGIIKRKLSVECDITKIDTCSGFTAYSADENIIILAFRGATLDTQQFMEAEESVFATHTSWIAGGKVSKYFNDGFIKLWNKGMKDDFTALSSKYPGAKLYITGHSLGGALAALCASYIAHNNLYNRNNILLYTFGELRVGDKDFAQSLDTELPHVSRVTHNKDPVPHLPMQYVEKYHHHETEIFYLEDMTPGADFTDCSEADESFRCSDGLVVEDDTTDHETYFSVNKGDYARNGCDYTGLNITLNNSSAKSRATRLL